MTVLHASQRSTTLSLPALTLALLSSLLVLGCDGMAGGTDDPGQEVGERDAGSRPGQRDAGAVDAGVVQGHPDAGPADAGSVELPDAGPADAGAVTMQPDAGSVGAVDAGRVDAGVPVVDAGRPDAGVAVVDAGRPDAGAGVVDAGRPDAGAGVVDAGALDAGRFDAGFADAGALDAGRFDAGAGVVDAGRTDAGTADAGISVCARFRGGNYVRQTDSVSRNIDGVANNGYFLTDPRLDLHNFVGLEMQIDWSMIESQPGQYSFARVDALMAQIKQHGKVMMLKLQDRSFWAPCSAVASTMLPVGIPADTGSDGRSCYARMWETATMTRYIATLIAVARHFESEPSFVGFDMEETATAVPYLSMNPSAYVTQLYPQRLRLAQEFLAAAPNMVLISKFNWPLNNDVNHFRSIVDGSMVARGSGFANGLGISWPDSFLMPSAYLPTFRPGCYQNATNGNNGCVWYQLARDRRTNVFIMPSVEGGTQSGTAAEAELHYQMLDTDIGAHAIIWDTWHAINLMGGDYFRNAVIPTVNAHQGLLGNTACPFAP